MHKVGEEEGRGGRWPQGLIKRVCTLCADPRRNANAKRQ